MYYRRMVFNNESDLQEVFHCRGHLRRNDSLNASQTCSKETVFVGATSAAGTHHKLYSARTPRCISTGWYQSTVCGDRGADQGRCRWAAASPPAPRLRSRGEHMPTRRDLLALFPAVVHLGMPPASQKNDANVVLVWQTRARLALCRAIVA